MSGILTDSEKAGLATDLDSVFQTFVRDIVVWKEPIRTALPPAQSNGGAFGFGGADVESNYIYTPVSGVFSAVVRYLSAKHVGQIAVMQDTNALIPIGEVKIKVTPECYAFVENGKTDKFSFDNRDWYFAGKPQATPFMGGLYYFYQLKPKV